MRDSETYIEKHLSKYIGPRVLKILLHVNECVCVRCVMYRNKAFSILLAKFIGKLESDKRNIKTCF